MVSSRSRDRRSERVAHRKYRVRVVAGLRRHRTRKKLRTELKRLDGDVGRLGADPKRYFPEEKATTAAIDLGPLLPARLDRRT